MVNTDAKHFRRHRKVVWTMLLLSNNTLTVPKLFLFNSRHPNMQCQLSFVNISVRPPVAGVGNWSARSELREATLKKKKNRINVDILKSDHERKNSNDDVGAS